MIEFLFKHSLNFKRLRHRPLSPAEEAKATCLEVASLPVAAAFGADSSEHHARRGDSLSGHAALAAALSAIGTHFANLIRTLSPSLRVNRASR